VLRQLAEGDLGKEIVRWRAAALATYLRQTFRAGRVAAPTLPWV